MMLLKNDIARVKTELHVLMPFLPSLSETRQAALIDMAFNLGISRFMTFKKMIAALKRNDFEEGARQMLDSRWANQVGQRAIRLSEIMRTGEF